MCFFVIFSQDKYHNVGKRKQHCEHTLVGTVNNTEHKSYKWKHRRSELINCPLLWRQITAIWPYQLTYLLVTIRSPIWRYNYGYENTHVILSKEESHADGRGAEFGQHRPIFSRMYVNTPQNWELQRYRGLHQVSRVRKSHVVQRWYYWAEAGKAYASTHLVVS